MKIGVTGARGFIGHHLTTLLTEWGHTVVPINRDDWDLVSQTSPAALLAGCDAVVHLAGRVHVRGQPADDSFTRLMMATNVRGTERLAGAAVDQGVRRFVFVSSASVYGRADDGVVIDERSPLRPETAYGRSKAAAEEALRAIAERTGLEAVALRPPPVYGPGMGGNFGSLLRIARRGLPVPSGTLTARRSFVSVTNFCDLVARALAVERPVRDAYVAAEPARTIGEVYRVLCEAAGHKPLVLPVPRGVLRLALGIAGRRALVGALTEDFLMDAGAAQRELGWVPRDLLADELSQAVAEACRP